VAECVRPSEKSATITVTVASSSSNSRKRVSLATGPIAVVGLAGILYGVLALIFGGHGFTLRVPHGAVGGGHYLHLLTNGWTDLLFVAAGLLLVVAARAHLAAKLAALLVALVLGAAAVIAVVRGDGVFGIFAANGYTEIVWGGAAILLALLSRMGRLRRGTGTAGGSSTPPPSDPTDDHPLVSSR
jgi:hypothetical protein